MQEVPHASQETVEAVDGVHLTQLAVGEQMSVQQFHIEPDALVPEHSHPHEQVGYLASGTLTFTVPDTNGNTPESTEDVGYEAFGVGPGDSYSIPGGEPHAAENRGAEPVSGIDVFCPPRTNPDWQD